MAEGAGSAVVTEEDMVVAGTGVAAAGDDHTEPALGLRRVFDRHLRGAVSLPGVRLARPTPPSSGRKEIATFSNGARTVHPYGRREK